MTVMARDRRRCEHRRRARAAASSGLGGFTAVVGDGGVDAWRKTVRIAVTTRQFVHHRVPPCRVSSAGRARWISILPSERGGRSAPPAASARPVRRSWGTKLLASRLPRATRRGLKNLAPRHATARVGRARLDDRHPRTPCSTRISFSPLRLPPRRRRTRRPPSRRRRDREVSLPHDVSRRVAIGAARRARHRRRQHPRAWRRRTSISISVCRHARALACMSETMILTLENRIRELLARPRHQSRQGARDRTARTTSTGSKLAGMRAFDKAITRREDRATRRARTSRGRVGHGTPNVSQPRRASAMRNEEDRFGVPGFVDARPPGGGRLAGRAS